jgi:hypothetical protein
MIRCLSARTQVIQLIEVHPKPDQGGESNSVKHWHNVRREYNEETVQHNIGTHGAYTDGDCFDWV